MEVAFGWMAVVLVLLVLLVSLLAIGRLIVFGITYLTQKDKFDKLSDDEIREILWRGENDG